MVTEVDSEGNEKKVLSVTITVIDSGGYTAKGSFSIEITDANDPPSDLLLVGTTLVSGTSANQVVGKLVVSDQDLEDD